MKKIFTGCFMLFLFIQCVYSQPTQAEIDKMMKQAQDAMNKYGKDSTVKNAMKGAQERIDEVNTAMKNQQGKNNSNVSFSSTGDPGSYANVDNWKFPVKNTLLLASLPKKILTKSELYYFLNDSYLLIARKMEAGIHSSVQSLVEKYGKNVSKMGESAVLGWYTDHKEEGLLLILKAASLDPQNLLLLNNCAALLNMSGLEQIAIPILKYVLQEQPASSLALNNMGQAYAGLGATDTAMIYLGRCIQMVPEHPEACNTVAHIEASKGNKEKAIEYFEKSIRSGYSIPASLKMRRLKKGAKIAHLIRPRIKLPEYFNMFKYDLPSQCISTDNAAFAHAEQQAFHEMISKQSQAYGKLMGELLQKKMQNISEWNGKTRKLVKGEFMAQSFYGLCGEMARDVHDEFSEEISHLSKVVNKDYAEEMNKLEMAYQNELKKIQEGFAKKEKDCCGDGKPNHCCPTQEEKCTAYNNLANVYLPKFAVLTEEMQKKHLRVFRQYFDELVYWNYLLLNPISKDNFRLNYYELIVQYLVTLGTINTTKIIRPCEFDKMTSSKSGKGIDGIECPLEIDIAFVIGSIELNCEKFSIGGGELILFKYERNFKTRQSTLNVGIGATLQLGKGFASASVEQYAFVKFDGDGTCSDAGIKSEASAEGGVGVGVKGEVGYVLGVSSGWDFNEGPFKNYIGPAPEIQINKNVPVYKPGK